MPLPKYKEMWGLTHFSTESQSSNRLTVGASVSVQHNPSAHSKLYLQESQKNTGARKMEDADFLNQAELSLLAFSGLMEMWGVPGGLSVWQAGPACSAQ